MTAWNRFSLWQATLCGLLALQVLTATALSAESTSDRWQRKLRDIDDLLAEEKWSKADRMAGRLRKETFESLVTGGQAHLGMLSALRAVAIYGKGDEHTGEWLWRVALQLFPETANLDLARYGSVGQALSNLEIDPPPDESEGEESSNEGIEPPRKVKEVMPDFPFARSIRGKKVSVVVGCIIDVDGLPYRPRIVEASKEYVFVFTALEALAAWRFEPATRDGIPITVRYTLAVNFVVP